MLQIIHSVGAEVMSAMLVATFLVVDIMSRDAEVALRVETKKARSR
jgi:hypothetical protein